MSSSPGSATANSSPTGSDYLANRLDSASAACSSPGPCSETSDELDLALVELESLPPGTRGGDVRRGPAAIGEPLRVVGHRLDLDTRVEHHHRSGPARRAARRRLLLARQEARGQRATVLIGQLRPRRATAAARCSTRAAKWSAWSRHCGGSARSRRSRSPRTRSAASPALARAAAKKPNRSTASRRRSLRATVWVRPTATDVQLAGVLIEHDLVLTVGSGLRARRTASASRFPSATATGGSANAAAYRDPLALARSRDAGASGTGPRPRPDRDLALIRLDSRLLISSTARDSRTQLAGAGRRGPRDEPSRRAGVRMGVRGRHRAAARPRRTRRPARRRRWWRCWSVSFPRRPVRPAGRC